MSIGSRFAMLVVAIASYCPSAMAQSQQVPQQSMPPVQKKDEQASPMRDFQQMLEAQRSQMQNRITAAIERIRGACQEEGGNFCSTVTPGEGRLLLCMQAHEDQLGHQCELALFDASRNIQQAAHRVERFADACGADILA